MEPTAVSSADEALDMLKQRQQAGDVQVDVAQCHRLDLVGSVHLVDGVERNGHAASGPRVLRHGQGFVTGGGCEVRFHRSAASFTFR